MSTRLQRKRLVRVVDAVLNYVDDEALEPWVAEDECDLYDDGKIGSQNRKDLAAKLRQLRAIPEARQYFHRYIQDLLRRVNRNPKRYGYIGKRPPKRLYPKTVNVPARPAKAHRDCFYCGYGTTGHVCGECSANDIDGPVIRGTEARRAYIYTKWTERS